MAQAMGTRRKRENFAAPQGAASGRVRTNLPGTLMSPLAGLENVLFHLPCPTAVAVGYKITPALRAFYRRQPLSYRLWSPAPST